MKKYKYIIATFLLILALGVAFTAAAGEYYRLEKEVCFDMLTEYASQLQTEMRNNLLRDQEYLAVFSTVISRYERPDSQETQDILSSFEPSGTISRLELLLPGDRLLTGSGYESAPEGLSFEAEAARGKHFSGRSGDKKGSGKQVIRSFTPVIKDSKTIALLCGVTDLDAFKDMFSVDAFNGSTEFFVICGGSGDILVNTWNSEEGNLNSFFSLPTRQGYSFDKMKKDVEAGINGSIVYQCGSSSDYYYSYYKPLGIEDWTVMLAVPENMAFQRLNRVIDLSACVAVFEVAAFLLYLAWMYITVRRDNFEKESQLGRVQYMFEVEKHLFDAHLNPEHIDTALEKIAAALSADTSFLLILDNRAVTKQYVWTRGKKSAVDPVCLEPEGTIYTLEDMNKSVISYSAHATASLKGRGIRNFMTTPVKGVDGGLIGILGVYNMKHHWKDAAPLECVSLSFSMAINNIGTYQTMCRMGTMDSLTGLLNRNSFHAAIESMSKESFESLACVYLDANGLHELNNLLGHKEGDQMLCVIGNLLKDQFGSGCAFRIGGDEFVVLCKNLSLKQVEDKVQQLIAQAKKKHYEISTGVEWRDADFDIDAIVKAAESRMRLNKQRYYEREGGCRKNREYNRKLEKMIMEKEDADTFLSVIASEFKGVYFVNLRTDTVRDLFIPEYFEEMLRKSGGRFSKAMDLYAHEKVKPEYYPQFQHLCDYKLLEKQLLTGVPPEFLYEKTDGSWMRAKVLKFDAYAESCEDTLWIFNPEDSGVADSA